MRTILMGVAVCAGFVALRSDASAATITLTSDPAVGVGQTTIVELVVDDLGAAAMAPSVGAYDITISFDANLLGFVGVAFGDPVLGNQLDLSGLGSIHGDDPGVSGVDVFEVALGAHALEEHRPDHATPPDDADASDCHLLPPPQRLVRTKKKPTRRGRSAGGVCRATWMVQDTDRPAVALVMRLSDFRVPIVGIRCA